MADPGEAERLLLLVVAYTVTAVWGASFLLDMWVKTYDPSPAITPPMLLVAGYCFRGRLLPRRRDGDDNGR